MFYFIELFLFFCLSPILANSETCGDSLTHPTASLIAMFSQFLNQRSPEAW